MLTTYDALVWK